MSDAAYLARPTKAQMDWHDMELGMFIHWFPIGWNDVIDGARIQEPAYQTELAARVSCSELDTDQWVQSAVDLGAKYIVFVAKHGMGFCRWQSDEGVFNMKNAPYKGGKGDPVHELSESCNRRGIKLGIYIAGDSLTHGVGHAGRTADPARQKEYDAVYRKWLTELLSRYGEMAEVWFDGSLGIEVGDILQKYAPNAMVFQSKYATIRWVGQEEGYASDPAWNGLNRYDAISGIATQRHGNPDGEAWMPLECDARLRSDWGWSDDLEHNPLRSLDELVDMYYRSVGHGAVLLLNQAPNPQGRIIGEDVERMKQLGDEIRRRFSNPIAQCSGEGEVVRLDLHGMRSLDHMIIMEDIRFGERIRTYRIEGFDGHEWKFLCAGTAVGHKKIDYFSSTCASEIRIRVLNSVGTPLIRLLAAYNVGVTPEIRAQAARGRYKIGDWGTEMYDLVTNSAHFKYAINAYTGDAGQYRVSFKPTKPGTALKIARAWVEADGVANEEYVRPGDGENEFDVYIGGVSKSIIFHAISEYPSYPHLEGEAFLQRIN